jgi:hypothetical protein
VIREAKQFQFFVPVPPETDMVLSSVCTVTVYGNITHLNVQCFVGSL